ncbi:MAG TPA: hypothetical protein VFG24_04795, partial [Nitrosopumilaceae archaeon]|nr:hypothetical protein [Nitrosopumilaceae archaeon]
DNGNIISDSYILSIVDASKDIPFKIKIPQIESKNAILEKPDVNFVLTKHNSTNIQVIYDTALIKHADGHTSGFIINNDTVSANGVKVYAVIYGKNGKFLDTGKSVETITEMKPGEKREFTMYPDSLLASKVSFYSCFALGEDPTLILSVSKGGNRVDFTYLTAAYLDNAKFDDSQNSLSITARNPWPQTSYVNFMIPIQNDNQKFSVYLDGKPADALQSKDPEGYWHLAFNLAPQSTSSVLISGFGEQEQSLLSAGNFRNYLLVIIPTVAIIVSVIIWKKRTN